METKLLYKGTVYTVGPYYTVSPTGPAAPAPHAAELEGALKANIYVHAKPDEIISAAAKDLGSAIEIVELGHELPLPDLVDGGA